jgi:hypothetical protein
VWRRSDWMAPPHSSDAVFVGVRGLHFKSIKRMTRPWTDGSELDADAEQRKTKDPELAHNR